jgi:hypothetical protein
MKRFQMSPAARLNAALLALVLLVLLAWLISVL